MKLTVFLYFLVIIKIVISTSLYYDEDFYDLLKWKRLQSSTRKSLSIMVKERQLLDRLMNEAYGLDNYNIPDYDYYDYTDINYEYYDDDDEYFSKFDILTRKYAKALKKNYSTYKKNADKQQVVVNINIGGKRRKSEQRLNNKGISDQPIERPKSIFTNNRNLFLINNSSLSVFGFKHKSLAPDYANTEQPNQKATSIRNLKKSLDIGLDFTDNLKNGYKTDKYDDNYVSTSDSSMGPFKHTTLRNLKSVPNGHSGNSRRSKLEQITSPSTLLTHSPTMLPNKINRPVKAHVRIGYISSNKTFLPILPRQSSISSTNLLTSLTKFQVSTLPTVKQTTSIDRPKSNFNSFSLLSLQKSENISITSTIASTEVHQTATTNRNLKFPVTPPIIPIMDQQFHKSPSTLNSLVTHSSPTTLNFVNNEKIVRKTNSDISSHKNVLKQITLPTFNKPNSKTQHNNEAKKNRKNLLISPKHLGKKKEFSSTISSRSDVQIEDDVSYYNYN